MSEPDSHDGERTQWLARPVPIVRSRAGILVGSTDGSAIELEGDSGELARAVLSFLAEPRTRRDIVAHVRELAEEPFDERVVDDLLEVLARAGAIAHPIPRETAAAPLARRRIVLAVSGAIQAVEAPRMVSELQRRGFEVWAAVTDAARHFVSDAALAALTHRSVPPNLWPANPAHPVPHVEMAEWADLVLVYPASATTLSRIATGDCSDVVSAIAITTRAPVVIAPSMNGAMWSSAAVRRNVETLVSDGAHIIAPGFGIEVADSPDERIEALGAALAPDRIASVVRLLATRYGKSRSATDWEAAYASNVVRPWETEALDGELLAALNERPPPRSLLDAGTGSGTVAIGAARLGYRVVATDISEAALAIARARDGADAVVFLRDDIAASHIRAAFDVVVDRGCLHARDLSELQNYARSLARLVAQGGRLLVVHDQIDASGARPTLRIPPDELAGCFGGFFLVKAEKTTLVPTEPGTAWLTILERRN